MDSSITSAMSKKSRSECIWVCGLPARGMGHGKPAHTWHELVTSQQLLGALSIEDRYDLWNSLTVNSYLTGPTQATAGGDQGLAFGANYPSGLQYLHSTNDIVLREMRSAQEQKHGDDASSYYPSAVSLDEHAANQETKRFLNAVDLLSLTRYGVTYKQLVEINAEKELQRAMGNSTVMPSLHESNVMIAAITRNSPGEYWRHDNGDSSNDRKPAAVVRHPEAPKLVRNGTVEYDADKESTSLGSPTPTHSQIPRRKCAVNGCSNRVVQGGLCIQHGAIRKTCNVPGCDKHVKKQGKCSAHGPERKKCEAEGCTRVAIQGGKCVGHGAKKKLCCVEGCVKQSFMGGMCKKHYDEHNGGKVRAVKSERTGVQHEGQRGEKRKKSEE